MGVLVLMRWSLRKIRRRAGEIYGGVLLGHHG
jgi:hypothetical protein